jgi:outer membrane protein TolC
MPIFTGGRIRGDVMVAQANVDEARARLQQTRELAALDTRNTIERLEAAEATWRASSGTVDQANRAYQIADLRFREGISTELELSDSRILLQQAQANRAVAARDLQNARARLALLKNLPVGFTTSPTTFPAAPSVTVPVPQQQPQQTQPQTPTRTITGVQTSVVGNQ